MQTRRFLRISLVVLACVTVVSVMRASVGNVRKVWVFETGDAAYPPAVGRDNTIYIGSGTTVYALNDATGQRKWQVSHGDYVATSPVVGPDNTLYFGAEIYGKPSRFYALDGATGSKKWTLAIGSRIVLLDHKGSLFVGQYEILCLDARTGKKRWGFKPPPHPELNENGVNDTGEVEDAVYDKGTVYVAFGCPYKILYALDAQTGKARWRVQLNDTVQFACSIPTSLAVGSNGILVVGQADDCLYAYDARTGGTRWRSTLVKYFIPEAVVGPDGTVYIGTGSGGVIALDGSTGSSKWQRRIGQDDASQPVLAQGGLLYVGAAPNKVYVLDAVTGNTQHLISLGANLVHTFAGYPDSVNITRDADGTIYAGSTDGRVFAIKGVPDCTGVTQSTTSRAGSTAKRRHLAVLPREQP